MIFTPMANLLLCKRFKPGSDAILHRTVGILPRLCNPGSGFRGARDRIRYAILCKMFDTSGTGSSPSRIIAVVRRFLNNGGPFPTGGFPSRWLQNCFAIKNVQNKDSGACSGARPTKMTCRASQLKEAG